AEAGQQDEAGNTDAEEATVLALRPFRRLLDAARVVSREAQRGVEAGTVVAAVVDHGNLRRRRPDVPRKLVSADEVASSHLDRIDVELLRQVIHGALEREDGLGLAGAAIRRRRRLACERAPDATGVMADPIGPEQTRRGDRRAEHAETAGVRAEVGEHV